MDRSRTLPSILPVVAIDAEGSDAAPARRDAGETDDVPTHRPPPPGTEGEPSCRHLELRTYPRLARSSPMLLASTAALLVGGAATGYLPALVVAGALMVLLAAGRAVGGVLWWGGWRCRACGQTTMYR